MSNLTVKGNASGTGTVILEAPNTNSNRTITLPDAATTLVGTDATQTLTNKTIQGGALTLDTAKASTSGTNIDFTGIPSWARRITVMFSGVSTNGSSLPVVRLGSGSVQASGYSGAVLGTGTSTLATTSTDSSGFNIANSGAASQIYHGAMSLINVNGNVWVATSVIGRGDSGSSHLLGGSVTISGTLDRIRITTLNGTDTFDAGTINIMWEG